MVQALVYWSNMSNKRLGDDDNELRMEKRKEKERKSFSKKLATLHVEIVVVMFKADTC